MSEQALLDSLTPLAEQFTAATGPDQLLSALVQGARGLLPFSACALALLSAQGWQIWRASSARPADVTQTGEVPRAAVETLERFVAHGQPLRINDLLAPPWSSASHRDVLWKEGTRSALLLPLHGAGTTVGALSFTSTRPDQYASDKNAMATFLAWMVATSIRGLPPSEETL